MKRRLPPRRFKHVLSVARLAEKLARRYGVSTLAARTAGMLHDVARHWKPAELLAYAAHHAIVPSELERLAPVLLHSRVGAHVAQHEFGIADPDVLGAIANHTVARPGMSDLQKVVYLADTLEPSREFPARAALQAAAERSLDEGLFACLKASLQYLLEHNVPLAPETVALYNQLVQRYGSSL